MKSLMVVLIGGYFATAVVGSDDWPQWRGKNRDDLSTETNLLEEWPSAGPKQLWRNDRCGLGYAGFSVVEDKLFTMGQEDSKQFVLCLNASDGTEVWRTPIGGNYSNRWGDGPRSTPTHSNGQVFVLTAEGTVGCLNASDGKLVWSVSLTDFGGSVPGWGYCESVLVDGDRVVCTPGGDQGAILALNRADGKKIWQTSDLTVEAHYSSIVSATINGRPQYVQLTVSAVVGVDPTDGRVIWKSDWPGETAVIPTPIVQGDSVYVTSGYGVGCKRLNIDGDKATEVWVNKVMKNHHGGVIFVDGYLYGYSDSVGWVCQDWETGKQVWSEDKALNKGAIAYADGRFYCLGESDGDVVLIDASPEGWKERGRFTLDPKTKRRKPSGAIWVHPVISDGRLFLRDQELIYCYDIAAR